MAGIEDLPVEAFNNILGHFPVLLNDSFPFHLRKLRLVCRAFDNMVVQFALRLPEQFDNSWQVDDFFHNLHFRERCLFERVAMKDSNRQSVDDEFITAIFQASDFIMDLANESNGSVYADRWRYLRVLCRAVTRRVGWQRIQTTLEGGTSASKSVLTGVELLNAALVAAVCDDNKPLFQLLLDKGADINAQSRIFGNPLRIAVINGNQEIAGALLRNKSRILHVDAKSGMTLLHWAAQEGRAAIVQEVLDQEDVDADPVNSKEQTPLVLAAKNAHTDVVKLLASRADVDPDKEDLQSGSTPLGYAAMHCDAAMAATLMSWGEVDVNARNNLGETPLQCAVGGSAYLGLLSRHDITVKYKDSSGKWQESTAAGIRSTPIVELFLSHDGVDFLAADRYGRTPLVRMVQSGLMNPVQRVLERRDFDPNVRNGNGLDVLAQAAKFGSLPLVSLLLDRDDTVPDSKDDVKRTPLSHAASSGRFDVVKLLLSRNDVDADSPDDYGRTPLAHAATSGFVDMVRLLADREDVNADSRSHLGQTPLAWAATSFNSREAFELLASRDDVNVDSRDSAGQTPLWHALLSGNYSCAEFLVARYDVDLEVEGLDQRTPAEYAEHNQEYELAALIRDKIAARQS